MVGKPTKSCRSARRGLAYYRLRHASWLQLRGIKIKVLIDQPKGCAHTLWTAKLWRERARAARVAYNKWLNSRYVLQDTPFGVRANAWYNAIDEVQGPFPGTESWLLSCSAAEGGHGRWVGYSGVGYSTWLRDSDTVGGPMQFRWSTFKGMYRRALENVLSRGYKVPAYLRNSDNDITWRSALGQALAAGWARWTGNDDSHWSASWSNGC